MSCTVKKLLVIFAVCAVAACGGPSDDEDAIREELSDKGTIDLMEEVDKAEYDPPADGEVSEAQLRMFLEVKEREAKIQQVAVTSMEEKQKKAEEEGEKMGLFDTMRAMGDLADVGTAGMRAAVELGHNPKEFEWVQEQVLEAYAAERQDEAMGQMSQAVDQMIEQMKAQRESVPEEQRAMLDEQIAQMEANAEETRQQAETEQEPGTAHNRELVREHREQIEQAMNLYERALLGLGAEEAEPPAAE